AISSSEIPRQFTVTVSKGPNPYYVQQPGGFYQPAQAVPPRSTRGPLWFRKMDRNGDGDVSQREFTGSPEQFKKLDLDGDALISVDEAEKAEAAFRKNRLPPVPDLKKDAGAGPLPLPPKPR